MTARLSLTINATAQRGSSRVAFFTLGLRLLRALNTIRFRFFASPFNENNGFLILEEPTMLRWRIEIVVATILAVLAVITLAWPNWIELVFGADPDGGDGSAEWGTVLVLAAGALIVGLLARYDYRRAIGRSRQVARSTAE